MENREYKKTINYIYDLLGSGMLKLGDRLPTERSFSEKLGISRNSVREALRILENLGIVESRQGSGNYLTNNIQSAISRTVDLMLLIQTTSKYEICEFRRNTEKSVCSFLIENGLSEEKRVKISDALNKLLSCSGRAEETEADKEFHYTLIRATGNRFWITFLEAVSDVYRHWIDEVLMNISDDDRRLLRSAHEAIVESIMTSDMASCRAAIDKHYDIIHRTLGDDLSS